MHGRCVSRCYRRQLADSPSASQASVPEETWHDPRTEDRRLLVDVDSVSRPVREAAAESREGADGQRDRQIYGHGAHAATVRARTSGETSQKRSPQTPKRPGREPVTVCTAVRSPREPRGNPRGPSRTSTALRDCVAAGARAGERKHELEHGAGFDDVIVSSRRRGGCCRWQMLRRSADMVFSSSGRATEVGARPCSAARCGVVLDYIPRLARDTARNTRHELGCVRVARAICVILWVRASECTSKHWPLWCTRRFAGLCLTVASQCWASRDERRPWRGTMTSYVCVRLRELGRTRARVGLALGKVTRRPYRRTAYCDLYSALRVQCQYVAHGWPGGMHCSCRGGAMTSIVLTGSAPGVESCFVRHGTRCRSTTVRS